METIACTACNWRFYVREGQEADFCPHCRSRAVSFLPEEKHYEPERYIPFQISKQQFQAQIAKFAGGIPFRPKDLTAANLEQRMEEIFLPRYLFDADVSGEWQAEMGFDYEVVSHQEIYEASRWHTVEKKEVRKNWSPRVGRLTRHYDNVSAPALLDDAFLRHNLGDFALVASEDVGGKRVASWMRVPDREVEDSWLDALSGFRERAAEECREASGADHVENFKWTPDYENRISTLMLLPVYTSYYLDDDHHACRVLVNGQSGVIGGVRKASEARAKRVAINLLVAAIVLLAMSFFLGLSSALFPPLGMLAIVFFIACLGTGIGAALPVFIARQFNRKEVLSNRR